MEEASQTLLSVIEDHRSKVSVISKRRDFYLNFSMENVSTWEFYSMCLALGGYLRSGMFYAEDSVEHYLLAELHREVENISKRFKETKYFKLFYFILNTPLPLTVVRNEYLLHPREYHANYKGLINASKALRVYSVRELTPRRVKRREFRRGYRDHGSMSSDSERARREAQPSETKERMFWYQKSAQNYSTPEPLSLAYILSEAREILHEYRQRPSTPLEEKEASDEQILNPVMERKKKLRRSYSSENLDFLHPEDPEIF
jgi:hypothetical protein